MIWPMDLEFTIILMEVFTQVILRMMYSMDKEKKSGLMVLVILGTIQKARRMVMENMLGAMVICIEVIGIIIR